MCMQSSNKKKGGNKSLAKHKTIIEDLDNIIKDFKTEVRFITKWIHCGAHFNERTDKIGVYFSGRSFVEIPIVL